MAADSWVYDGATWRNIATWWAYDGASWRDIQTAWSYDGSVWRKVFEAVSCDTGTCIAISGLWTPTGGRFCTACGAGTCALCMKLNWGVCTDPCHNIDGYMSTNGGSYLIQTNCNGRACANDTGCDCGVGGSWDFSCDMTRNCLSQGSTYQGRFIIQRDSDSGTDCTITESSSHTGICVV